MNTSESPDLIYSRSFEEGLRDKYELVASYVKPFDHVLELGCADGYFGQALNMRGAKVTGIEGNEIFAQCARERGVNVISCDLDDVSAIKEIEGKFEVILAMDLLEHLKNPKECLIALRVKLKPKGKLLVTGPNVAYWWVRLALLRGNWKYEKAGIMDETHLRFFTMETWGKLLQESGFDVSQMGAAETGMIPAQRWVTKILGCRFTEALAAYLTRKMPRLFATVFFMVGKPHE